MRVAVVTGANTGVGLQTAIGLARKPHSFHVVLACRSVDRAREAVNRILTEYKEASVSIQPLDLTDLDDVIRCAHKLVCDYPGGIDVLVCNAGIGGFDRPIEATPDGSADLTCESAILTSFSSVQGPTAEHSTRIPRSSCQLCVALFAHPASASTLAAWRRAERDGVSCRHCELSVSSQRPHPLGRGDGIRALTTHLPDKQASSGMLCCGAHPPILAEPSNRWYHRQSWCCEL